jgi:hypothetical protein
LAARLDAHWRDDAIILDQGQCARTVGRGAPGQSNARLVLSPQIRSPTIAEILDRFGYNQAQ